MQIARRHGLHRTVRTNRHKDWRLHAAVWEVKLTKSRWALRVARQDIEVNWFGHIFVFSSRQRNIASP